MVDGMCSSTAPGFRICSRFPLPRRSMAQCPRAGIFRGEEKTVSYTADEGFRLAKLSVDGLYLPVTEYPDSYTFSDIQKDHTLAVTFEPVPTATPTPTATATPTETPAITQTPEPAISKAPASSTVSFSSVASHFAAFWKSTVHAASWFRHLASAGASFARIRKRRSCFSGDAVCPSRSDSALCPPPAVCPTHPAGAVAESAGTQKKNVRRTGQRIYGRSSDEEVSIDELLLTIDELQKEEQKNT